MKGDCYATLVLLIFAMKLIYSDDPDQTTTETTTEISNVTTANITRNLTDMEELKLLMTFDKETWKKRISELGPEGPIFFKCMGKDYIRRCKGSLALCLIGSVIKLPVMLITLNAPWACYYNVQCGTYNSKYCYHVARGNKTVEDWMTTTPYSVMREYKNYKNKKPDNNTETKAKGRKKKRRRRKKGQKPNNKTKYFEESNITAEHDDVMLQASLHDNDEDIQIKDESLLENSHEVDDEWMNDVLGKGNGSDTKSSTTTSDPDKILKESAEENDSNSTTEKPVLKKRHMKSSNSLVNKKKKKSVITKTVVTVVKKETKETVIKKKNKSKKASEKEEDDDGDTKS